MYFDILFLFLRKWVETRNELVLVGVVTGNPSGCNKKTLPDFYNFVGNEEVNKTSTTSALAPKGIIFG